MADDITVLIADDHPMFRFGLRALLEAEGGFTVVGEAAGGHEAVDLAARLRPRVVLMDIAMPGLNGIEATEVIMEETPGTAVLIITMVDDDSVFAAVKAGARGYLLKEARGEETLRAIRAVANGEAIFSPDIAARVLDYFAQEGHRRQEAPPFPELTPREREILALVARGLTNSAIAEELVLSPKTVRNQVSIILSKLQVANRAEAIIRARDEGL